ncbi:hypothetical protein ACHAXA_007043 [Cyclostephanos tholiformis]|uniref:GH18 domain-containing protein n=1 Tax=Cyclostephanos tholiformis TaxID=382380 RepID=A0ABD3RBP9_9STRA
MNDSVYHRARILASIFPWLIFSSILPISSVSAEEAAGTTAAVGGHELFPPPSRRRLSRDEMSPAANLDARWRRRRNKDHRHKRRRLRDDRRNSRHRREQAGGGTKVQRYCGKTWVEANSSCLRPCPDGISEGVCDFGEMCFSDLTSCPSMIAPPPQPPPDGGGVVGLGEAVPGGYYDGGAFPSPGSSLANEGIVLPAAATTTTATTDGLIEAPAVADVASSSLLPFQVGTMIPPDCPSSTTNVVNVGYYQSWAKYRNPNCNPQRPSDVPVSDFGYTHLIYSFADISPEGEIRPYGGVLDEIALYEEFNALKETGGEEG